MTVRLAMLSTAHVHANHYAEALEAVEEAELVAVADEQEDRGAAYADEYGLDHGPAEEVLADVDGAVVCAANAHHDRWVTEAADAGVDVLCEKPLATDAETAQSLVDRCDEAGVALGVAMPVRFNQPIRQAKRAYEAGELGELQALIGTNLLTRMTPDTWITDPDLAGGGAIMDHTVHVVDLARWITGEEVTEVYAQSGTRFADLDVEDIAILSMELSDGTPFSHDGSWRQPESWDFWGDVTMRLIGDEQVIEVDCFDRTLTHTTEESGVQSVDWGEDMNAAMLRDFATAIAEGRDPETPGTEGVAEIRVVEAAYDSYDAGQPVSISYD